jgi:hypothetical protein
MVDYRNKLHAITRKNVIDYNWLWLQITITPCLSAAVFHYIKKKSTAIYLEDTGKAIYIIYTSEKWQFYI